MLQLYTANFCYPWFLINLKWWSSSFGLHQVFPNFDGPNDISQIQQAPGPDFRKVGKSLINDLPFLLHTNLKLGKR